MSKPSSGLFKGTLGSSCLNGSAPENTYASRGIEVPEHIGKVLSQLQHKGEYITGNRDIFSERDVSIMSRESGVEFAKVSIDGKTYLIRGDENGTTIRDNLLKEMQTGNGKLEFHSHPHNDDCVPSKSDLSLMKALRKSTGQQTSVIVTPNGRRSIFNERGIIAVETVSNRIDSDLKKIYLEMFGGK